jgi:hypothetical protein
MNNIHNLNKYKESLVVLTHIDAILRVFNLAERSLSLFKVYIPVAKVLHVIKEQKALLELHKKEYERIKSTKGMYNEKT